MKLVLVFVISSSLYIAYDEAYMVEPSLLLLFALPILLQLKHNGCLKEYLRHMHALANLNCACSYFHYPLPAGIKKEKYCVSIDPGGCYASSFSQIDNGGLRFTLCDKLPKETLL